MTDYQAKNLAKGHKFTKENAGEFSAKGVAARGLNKRVRDICREHTDEKDIVELLNMVKDLAKKRKNLKAVEIFLKMLGEETTKQEVVLKTENPYGKLTEAELRKLIENDTE